MTLHRAYDPDLARWLSADPIGPDELGNEYAYVRNNPLAFVDPLGLVEVRWNERVRFGDPDIACSRQTGGACSRAGAAVTGFCQPECGGYKMNSLLFVNADITVSPGPYPYKGRKPRDPSVRDAESAFVHEFRVHLIPAASAAAAVLAVFEQPLYPSESACRLAIGIARTVAVGRFNAVLAETMTNDR